MGLFHGNISLLYREGAKAFLRLQEQIARRSDNHTIFLLTDYWAPKSAYRRIFVRHLSEFSDCHEMVRRRHDNIEERLHYSFISAGLQMCLRLIPTSYLAFYSSR